MGAIVIGKSALFHKGRALLRMPVYSDAYYNLYSFRYNRRGIF